MLHIFFLRKSIFLKFKKNFENKKSVNLLEKQYQKPLKPADIQNLGYQEIMT